MLVIFTKCASLSIFGTRRVLWNHFKCQFGDGSQTFRGIFLDEVNGVLLPKSLDLLAQQLKLIKKQGVRKDCPAVND
jgi:hypothetical protein